MTLRILAILCLFLIGLNKSANAQAVKVYTYEETPALGPFPPTSLPSINTVFSGTDPWGLPWFSGDADTSASVIFEHTGTTVSPTISDQVIMEKVIYFCGQTDVQFRLNSSTEQDLCWLYVSPNSNPQLAVQVLALESGAIESIPATAPIDPKGGIFVRAYLSDDTDDASIGVEWRSAEQPFWAPLVDDDLVSLNGYSSELTDSVICIGDNTDLTMENSDLGISYVLRDDADNSVVDGPYLGVGGPLVFNTGSVTEETTFHVYALGAGDALNFDGVNDHVLIPYDADYELTDGTIEVIIKPESVGSNQTFLAFENAAGTSTAYSFHILPGLTGIGFDNGSSIETITTAISEDWQMLSFVDNGTNTEAFIDGVSIGTFPIQFGTVSDASMNLILGGNGPLSEMFNGDMEEVRIYDIAKNSADIITDLDSCLMGSEEGLIAYYSFEDSYGSTTLQDITISGNDGALTNMDEFTDWVSSTPLTCASCDVQMPGLYTVYVPYALETVEICEGDSAFLQSAYQTESGIYFDTLTSAILPCDSIIETELIVHPIHSNPNPLITICTGDSVLIFGNYESVSGTYYDSLTSSVGCDSIVIQELMVGEPYFEELPDAFICPFDSVLVFDTYEHFPGVYYDSLLTVTGCDSVYQRTVHPSSTPPVGIVDYGLNPICAESGPVLLPLGSPAGGSYSGEGVSGDFFDPTGLSSGTYYTSYTYTSPHGCSNTDSTAVMVMECLGLEEWADELGVQVYPNPSNGTFVLQLERVDTEINLQIFSTRGQLIHQELIIQNQSNIQLPNPAPGIYLMQISSEKGVIHREIVVE